MTSKAELAERPKKCKPPHMNHSWSGQYADRCGHCGLFYDKYLSQRYARQRGLRPPKKPSKQFLAGFEACEALVMELLRKGSTVGEGLDVYLDYAADFLEGKMKGEK